MSPWLVLVDPQRVFADPASPWGAPRFAATLDVVHGLVEQHRGRVVVTRWVPAPAEQRHGSWRAYFEAWPFADRPAADPMFDVVDDLAHAGDHVLDAPTFGKWAVLEPLVGPAPELVVAGVSTDCCVVSTVLAAADAGATVRVVADACAGSTDEAHGRALALMAGYAPQVTIA